MTTLLETTNLTKNFGDNRGVFDINISINSGEIVGFVGPNGAGKSTTINLISDLVHADTGSVSLFGKPVTPNTVHHYMQRIGILLSETTLNTHLSASQTFKESAELLGIDLPDLAHTIASQLKLDTSKQIKKLSLGNKKKVGIINALMHQPELVIMDEPTSGLDPVMIKVFTTLLKDVTSRGGSVFLSSHDLSEIQQVCDRIIMIRDGAVLLSERTDTLLSNGARRFSLINPPKSIRTALARNDIVHQFIESETEVSFVSKDVESIIKLLTKDHFFDFYIERPSLESLFEEYYV